MLRQRICVSMATTGNFTAYFLIDPRKTIIETDRYLTQALLTIRCFSVSIWNALYVRSEQVYKEIINR